MEVINPPEILNLNSVTKNSNKVKKKRSRMNLDRFFSAYHSLNLGGRRNNAYCHNGMDAPPAATNGALEIKGVKICVHVEIIFAFCFL